MPDSVGLEDLDDLVADFERGLAAARAATPPTAEATTGTPADDAAAPAPAAR